jgi:hypothetical protein
MIEKTKKIENEEEARIKFKACVNSVVFVLKEAMSEYILIDKRKEERVLPKE